VTVRAILYNTTGDDREVDLAAEGRLRLDDKQLLWVDVDDRETADLTTVAAAVGIEPEGLGRLAQENRTAALLRLPERVVITIGAVDPDDEDARRHEVDIVVGANHVVTVHEGPVAAIDEFRADLQREPELGRLDSVGFSASLLDAIVTDFSRQIEAIERAIDELDEVAIRSRDDSGFLTQVLVLRRRIARLRRVLAPNREALLPLERPDFEVRSDLGTLWPGVIQRLERTIDGLENARELLVGSFDLYLGRSSQRTNDVMKVLTLVSSIALPAIVLAGVMGMNFKLGFFDESTNFFVVVAVMVVTAVAILAFARWRRWI